ncbi:unnamed protein product, partial [Heterosigma akashiwo]
FEYGRSRQGYWNGERMSVQLQEMMWVAEHKYPGHYLCFIFDDYSQCHDCLAADALTTGRMNVGPGGKNQPTGMRPAKATKDYKKGKNYPTGLKEGELQNMYFKEGDAPPDGMDELPDEYWKTPTLKGMKYIILQERGLYTEGMTKNGGKGRVAELSMKDIIDDWPEFRAQKSILHDIIEAAGHTCLFSPKYHCELMAQERVWGKSKWNIRQNCEYTWASLKKQIPISL